MRGPVNLRSQKTTACPNRSLGDTLMALVGKYGQAIRSSFQAHSSVETAGSHFHPSTLVSGRKEGIYGICILRFCSIPVSKLSLRRVDRRFIRHRLQKSPWMGAPAGDTEVALDLFKI